MKTRKAARGVKLHKVTAGGQVSLPAAVRRRWQTTTVGVEIT